VKAIKLRWLAHQGRAAFGWGLVVLFFGRPLPFFKAKH
jgi:hypothetical protein